MPRKKLDPWFKAEANAMSAIDNARVSTNWSALADEIKILSEARLARVHAAHNGKSVHIISDSDEIEAVREGGRYLIQPPLVARDASLLDGFLKSKGISGVVACREPDTRLGLCPIVALGSGVKVRVQIDAPKNPKKPTCAWFDYALEELGTHVVEKINPDTTTQRQLDGLIAHFSAIPTYTGAYLVAIDLCNTLANENV
jgi:hypothetical protein